MEIKYKLPNFDDEGLLPPGCYDVTLKDIKTRFVDDFPNSKTRKSRFDCFIKVYGELLENVKSCTRILIDGSFVTKELNPYDVDFVIVINDGYLLEKELNYLTKIFDFKSNLRREYDFFEDEIRQGNYDSSKLYELDLFHYGCDFFLLYKLEPNHTMYNVYLKKRDYWIDWWGKTRDNTPKGFLNLNVDYDGDFNGL